MVVAGHGTTILPPTPRSRDRLPRGLCRCSARHVEAHNDRNNESSIDSNNDANVFSNNASNNFSNNTPYNAAYNRARSSRRSPLFSCRRTCRRSALRSSRYLCPYFPANNDGYFVGRNRAFGARPTLDLSEGFCWSPVPILLATKTRKRSETDLCRSAPVRFVSFVLSWLQFRFWRAWC
jgi:hypothetical protein